MNEEKDSPKPKREPKLVIPYSIEIVFITIVLIFFGTLVGFAWVVDDIREVAAQNAKLVRQSEALIQQNQNRIDDIQNNRIRFCQKVYTAIGEVFEPFVPPPELRTPEQQENILAFNERISTLTNECNDDVEGGK
jgi:hypothetical protein